MNRRLLATSAAASCVALAMVCLYGQQAAQSRSQGKDPPDEVFGLTKVWAMHLDISAKEYQAMQPAPFQGFGPGQPPKGKPAEGGRPGETNLFGMQFPWAQADMTADGTPYKKVGVRYAGDGSYFVAAANLKRPLKIEFSRFQKQSFHGLEAIDLHAGTQDPSRGREALAFAVFRAAGVPAPRTAFAQITLTSTGKFDKEYVGLFTLVEPVDKHFLEAHFKTGKGLLMTPARMRGLDYVGDDWDKYKGNYQPQTEATKEQAKRVIDFARLLNQGTDEQFAKDIGSFLDVDEFLRYMAANALLSNLNSFLALGSNYHVFLHPESNKFVFIPGDLESALGNLAFMGTPQQQLELSLAHPYPGDSKLPDRLLAIKDVNDRYRKLLQELATTAFAKERLLKDIEAIEKATKEIVVKDEKAAAARKEGPGGFGAPGVAAKPPDLRDSVEKRTASITAQLEGKSKGVVPQFNFGPIGGAPGAKAAPATPVDDKTVHDLVQAPPDFDVKLYAAPPMVGYPVALSAAPDGALFVAVDEQGSLGRTPGGGKILRLVDTNGDGKAVKATVFAKVEHPRGVIAQNGAVWVMHPPNLSVFHDDDGDGVADRQELLVTGLTTDMIDNRGGDHTTNGIRMGIDGWIYICVGDYGIKEARGKDGTKLSQRGGGILRVRPDGTELEVFATGTRNVFDIAIDPSLNLFARDNTNDGLGWDTRVSHFIQSAHYGYTQLYANFTDEIMPTMGAFGSGGATGGLFIQNPWWPEKYRNTLFTGDWGRNEVYRHELQKAGPTFDLKQEVFLKMPRPTGMDIDAAGHLYVASWRGGEASVYIGPNVGFIARIAPRGLKPAPQANLKELDTAALVRQFGDLTAVTRLPIQREILRRGRKAEMTTALVEMAAAAANPLFARIAAIFTLAQLDGKDARPALLKLAKDASVREFALRALTDRKPELGGLDAAPFVAALADESPRVQAQALISLGRLKDVSAAKSIIPLTSRPKGSVMPTKKPVNEQPDPDRVIPHLAVRALVSLKAVDACLEALDGPHFDGALWAMRYMHDEKAAVGLIKKLGTARTAELRLGILATLTRLYYREADYTGSWWGIHPDNTGPYWDPQEWEMSKRIGAVLTSALGDSDPQTVAFLRSEFARHHVPMAGLLAKETTTPLEKNTPIAIAKADPKNPDLIGNMPYEVAAKKTLQTSGDSVRGKALFTSQSCIACHTYADGQTPKGPHLVEIGKRYSPAELVESILKPSAKIAQGYETYLFLMKDGLQFTGFVVTQSARAAQIRDVTGIQRELKLDDIDSRQIQKQSAMPEGLVSNLTAVQLADLVAYLRSLK